MAHDWRERWQGYLDYQLPRVELACEAMKSERERAATRKIALRRWRRECSRICRGTAFNVQTEARQAVAVLALGSGIVRANALRLSGINPPTLDAALNRGEIASAVWRNRPPPWHVRAANVLLILEGGERAAG